MPLPPQTNPSLLSADADQSSVTLLWDHQSIIPLTSVLAEESLIILLTPAIVPPNTGPGVTSDPFEPLGRALAKTHPWIRHVPYTKQNGITGTHVAFVKRATAVIFVMTALSSTGGVSQADSADVVREVCEERPMITVVCYDVAEQDMQDLGHATVVRSHGISLIELEAIATLIMTRATTPSSPSLSSPFTLEHHPSWTVQLWDYESDLAEIHALWLAALPQQFFLSRSAFGKLLKRDGHAMHYIVRDPASGNVLGFCATFRTFADSSADTLIGSIAAIIVRNEARGQGLGKLLHDEALGGLNKVRGVNRIQLGSTFPRLLYGVPVTSDSSRWFSNRGWVLDEQVAGGGRVAADWLWEFGDSPIAQFSSAGLTFRPCQMSDYQQVLDISSREPEKRHSFGWYDQYAKTLDSSHMGDILVGFEGETLVATAITYVPKSGSTVAGDLPWASSTGSRNGGVTCICIKGDDPDMVNRRDSVMIRLLQACRQSLSDRGMRGIFLDAVTTDDKALITLGFRKWAEYREAWRKVGFT